MILKSVTLLILLSITSLATARNELTSNHFLDLSIEELMKVKVTTFSRTPQKLTEVASAIFVITQDDIRRSGATSIPEALRMAPGVQVGRIGTDKWAISIRGFNGLYDNKLQVLMDGRSVYSPAFSGVLWEHQDTMMEDIERIEVIRGPAATSWGSNAVNGVINIITKKAVDTQGTLITAGGGSFEQGFMSARYGGMINEETPFRVYAKGFTRGQTQSLSGANANDQWHSARGGFRFDHHRGRDQFTLQGDYFSNFHGSTLDNSALSLSINPAGEMRGHDQGGNVRFRWDRSFSDQSSLMLQMYYDRHQSHLPPIGKLNADSFDVDMQYRFPVLKRHNVTWGAHYRLYHNKFINNNLVSFSPQERINHLAGTFIRDDITLIPERLLFSIGSRFEHNDFTGMEIQPNGRLMWTPNESNSVWLAISRAVRTPSRGEIDGTINVTNQLQQLGFASLPSFGGIPISYEAILNGNKRFNSEKLIAYELGYRHQFSPQASIDIAGFVNDYSQLRDIGLSALSLSPGIPIKLLQPVIFNNSGSALTYGLETSIDWKPRDNWRLQGNYSFIHIDFNASNAIQNNDPNTSGAGKANPQHQVSVRSNYDFSEKLQLNLWLRYTSAIPIYNIPGYVMMDAKLTYRPIKNTELFVAGQNLFSQYHKEFASDFLPLVQTQIPRGIYAGVQWRF
ncbi:MAG: TonB-dependent receptor [Nitrosomonas sp.]|nr:MAG: TonB-dependent receptor [Nitrosomonas sp.]